MYVNSEHVAVMKRDDPMYLANYSSDNDLLDKPERKQFCPYVNNSNKMNRLIKADKAKQLRNTVKIKFGMRIQHYKEQ